MRLTIYVVQHSVTVTPVDLAAKLGLKTLATTSSDGRWTSIAFQTRGIGEPGYFDDVRAVTQFRESLEPWTLLGAKTLTVASQLSLWTRFSTWMANRRTRAARAEAQHRAELYLASALARSAYAPTFAAPRTEDAPRA